MDLNNWKRRVRSIPFAGAALATVSRRLRGPLRSQVYSIDIFTGPDLAELGPRSAASRPVVTAADVSDIEAAFVADPFLLRTDEAWHMYFEVLPTKRQDRLQKGVISLATSTDAGLTWRYDGVVLKEPFHLSYPYVFEHDGERFLVPEAHERGAVPLYKATAFPYGWEHVADLLTGNFTDASLFHHEGSWWMFVESVPIGTRREGPSADSSLRLFFADELLGPWTEHPRSPISTGDLKLGHPAGRPVIDDQGRLLRFAQDCTVHYGAAVYALHVGTLNRREYAETLLREEPILSGRGAGWNADGMHHLDAFRHAGQWHALVDGWRFEVLD